MIFQRGFMVKNGLPVAEYALPTSRIVRGRICFSLSITLVLAFFGNSAFSADAATTPIIKPLALKLPAPPLKGRAEQLPEGPNIEPISGKLPPTVLVPNGVTNVAAGRPVTSSDPPTAGKLSQVTDGAMEAFDFDTVEMKNGSQWIQVDLGEKYAIYAIVMWHDHRQTQTMHDVIVQVSDDPAFQKDVTTLFNNDRDNSSGLGSGSNLEYFERHFGRVVDGKGVKARYVRGYSKGSNLSELNCWQELEVYGLPADSKGGDVIPSSTNQVGKGAEPLKLQLPAPTLK